FESLQQVFIGTNLSTALDFKNMLVAWHQRHDGDRWLFENIVEAVDSAIAGPVRIADKAVVLLNQEVFRIALRADIDLTTAVHGRHGQKGGLADELGRVIRKCRHLPGKPEAGSAERFGAMQVALFDF